MNDNLQQRFPNIKRKWGRNKEMFSVLVPEVSRVEALNILAEYLTDELGYKVTRQDVINNDYLAQDSDLDMIQEILKEQYDEEERASSTGDSPEFDRSLQR